jgi:hypothetical protein
MFLLKPTKATVGNDKGMIRINRQIRRLLIMLGDFAHMKITAFTHPEYDALRKRSERLAVWWGVGHVFFVLFAIMAIAMPLAMALVPLISADVPKERLIAAAQGSLFACSLISALGYLLRRYVSRKSRSIL